jgi:hypothetical protein
MNKIRHSFMDTVVVALVAKRYAITQFMAQAGVFFYLFDMVRFEFAVSTALLAFIAVTLQYRCFPCQIFGAAPSLILTVTLALGYTLAFDAAIGSVVSLASSPIECHRLRASKFFRANFTSDKFCIRKRSAFTAAIHRPANVGRGSFYFLTAVLAMNRNLLRLIECRALSGAESFLLIRVPIPVRLFRDDIPASFAML